MHRHDERYERAADLEAERVLNAPTPAAAPSNGRLAPLPAVASSTPLQAAVRDATASVGQPLDHRARAFFEPRFGRDFSRVRLHADAKAAQSAQTVNALAYAVDRHIVWGGAAPPAHTAAGRWLMAHELAHVVQQADGVATGIQCKPAGGLFPSDRTNYRFDTAQITADDLSDPDITMRLQAMTRAQLRDYRKRVMDPDVQEYIDRLLVPAAMAQVETNATILTKADMDAVAGATYWEQRTMAAFDLQPTPHRITVPEERDAVLSALWQTFPQGRSTPPTSKTVTIPPNPKRKEALLYRFVVRPSPTVGGKPLLDIEFQLARPGSVAATAPEPPKGYIAPALTFTSDMGFPKGADVYFQTHRDERRQIGYWIKQQSGSFEQLVVTRTTPKEGKGLPQETAFLVSGKKEKSGELSELHIELRPGGKPKEVTPSDDYRNRDYADLLLEDAKFKPHAALGDTLGDVNVTGVPADEALSVKYAIVRYFDDVKTRNAEADVLVPIAGTQKQVYYSLHFRPNNDVDVERIGEKGSSPKLDPTKLDVARARGYEENAATPAKLKTWLGKRYPGVTPTGATVEELRTSVNAKMATDVGAPGWYQSNYKITVIGGKATQTRLRAVHKLNAKQTPDADNKDYSAGELKLAELSLQTLTEKMLTLMRFVRLGRKKNPREADGTVGPYSGQMFRYGSDRTIVIYDAGIGTQSAAVGGVEGVHVREAMVFTHEMGHVTEGQTNGKPAFDKFVAAAGIKPFTHYAESKPGSEFYAEAFAIYQTDPEWLRVNHPEVYFWMDEFNRTGKAPAVKK